MNSAAQPEPMSPALRRVVILLLVNLGLSVVLTVLVLLFRDSILAYQLDRLALPPGADRSAASAGLSTGLWSRMVGVLVVAVVYAVLVRRLRQGRRRAYLRVLWISIVGLGAIVYLIVSGQYPVWMRIEQILQGLVLLALLWAVTRPAVRDRFARNPSPARDDALDSGLVAEPGPASLPRRPRAHRRLATGPGAREADR